MGMIATHARCADADKIRNSENAAAKIKGDFRGLSPAQVLFFAGDNYDFEKLAVLMRDAFPGAITFGCSSSGEMADGVLYKGVVAAMAFESDIFERFEIAPVFRLDGDGVALDPRAAVDRILDDWERKLGKSMLDLDFAEYVGIALADGNHYFPEPVLERIGERTNVIFTGAVASDEGRFVFSPVFFDGRVLSDAMLISIAKPRRPFMVLKTQGMKLTDHVFTVTRADAEGRAVLELDGRPAAEVVSEAIGKPVDALHFGDVFKLWSFALMVNNEPLLRYARGAMPCGGIELGYAVKEGMRLALGTTDDIVATTAAVLADAREKLGGFTGMLHFNCLMRQTELESRGELEKFGALFRGYPSVGFASHGEI